MKATATLAAVAALALFAPDAAVAAPTIYPCQDVQAFSSTTLTLVTTVKPGSNSTWTFPEAPSVVAQRLLTDLNSNSASITFKEASGVIPNLYLNVTLTETNQGTQQDSAYVNVTGLAKAGTLFNESSGQAPYIGWRDAIDHLATNMLTWFQQGWHTNGTCRRPDGTIRHSWSEDANGYSSTGSAKRK
jgi:hypothetical protein